MSVHTPTPVHCPTRAFAKRRKEQDCNMTPNKTQMSSETFRIRLPKLDGDEEEKRFTSRASQGKSIGLDKCGIVP